MVLTVLNLKGGVGKTHSVWLLASVCQQRGQRILLIDTDTQGNLSSSFLDEVNTVPGVEMLLHPGSDHNPLPLVRRTPFAHIDIIPSSAAVAMTKARGMGGRDAQPLTRSPLPRYAPACGAVP